MSDGGGGAFGKFVGAGVGDRLLSPVTACNGVPDFCPGVGAGANDVDAAVGTVASAFDDGAGAGPRVAAQPINATTMSTATIGNTLLRRRGAENGVPRSGASPRRRLASDFFNASRINDMIRIV